ncbi:MAG: hypothetical protein PHG40_04700, partial [Candidatus Omnitrophica bacterium]|nr:hypothetical protein [Candidatus Omnitrophota bacterium]
MRGINRSLSGFFLLSALCLLPACAQAAEEDDFANETDSYVRYTAGRSLKAQPGKVQLTRSELNYSYNLKLYDRLPVKFTVNPEYVNINNSSAVDLPAHLTGFSADVETTL